MTPDHTPTIEWEHAPSMPDKYKKMPKGSAWTLSSAAHAYEPIPRGVMLGAFVGHRFCHIAPASVVLPGPTRDERALSEKLARQLWDAWIKNGCRSLTEEQAGTIMLGRILLQA